MIWRKSNCIDTDENIILTHLSQTNVTENRFLEKVHNYVVTLKTKINNKQNESVEDIKDQILQYT